MTLIKGPAVQPVWPVQRKRQDHQDQQPLRRTLAQVGGNQQSARPASLSHQCACLPLFLLTWTLCPWTARAEAGCPSGLRMAASALPRPASPTPEQLQSHVASPLSNICSWLLSSPLPQMSLPTVAVQLCLLPSRCQLSPWPQLPLPQRGESNGRSSCLVQDQGQKAQGG